MTAEEIARLVVTKGVAPAAAAGCAAYEGLWHREMGGEVDLLFDLASLTKPMTAVAVARSGLDRSAPLGLLLPEARGTASEHVPLELFVAHRSGLKAHLPLHAPLLEGAEVDVSAALRVVADSRRDDARGPAPAQGFAPVYSDLGYILVGAALARAASARDAGEAIFRAVIEPLSLGSRMGTVRELAAHGVVGPFAPTEFVPWRGGLVTGAVHDENAWALTGRGGSGHAGIFGTVDAVTAFAAAVVDALDGRSRFGELGWLVGERPGGTLRAGFDGKSAVGSSAGARMAPTSFGHLGFTGTSLWVDPESKIVAVLLTNRVSPSRDHVAIRDARPWVHDALWERAHDVLVRRSHEEA